MITLNIPAVEDKELGATDKRAWAASTIAVSDVRTFRLGAARAAEGAAVRVEVAEDDVVELELEDGIRLWVRADELADYFPQPPARGVEQAGLTITPQLSLGPVSRGLLGKLVLKALRLIKTEVAAGAALAVARRIEDKLPHGPGLFRCTTDRFDLLPPGQIPGDRPILLFIHGTFSTTEGSFADLWKAPNARLALFAPYGGQVFAYEHRSVSVSPLDNALELVEALPAGARLHLVSHSRGGLIGELLCRSRVAGGAEPFDGKDLQLFEGRAEEERAKLRQLNLLLKTRNLAVERFVRVACPARGTTLASGRLDRWLSALVNVVGQVPFFKENAIYDLLTEFVLAVAKARTRPESLPGLEAQMPDSPLIRMLNRPGVKVHADLRVVEGDIEGEGFFGRLKLLLPDLFYGGEHDLVVNTASMTGGAERVDGVRYSFHQGATVSHFHYFHNEDSQQRVIAGLTAGPGQDDGFLPLLVRPDQPIPRFVRGGKSEGPRPQVFVLPGIMGSHLAVGDDRVWLDPVDLALGHFGLLAIDSAGVRPDAPIEMCYGDLIDHLSQSHEVRPFAYDWRRSIREEARRLGDAIEAILGDAERDRQPVRILAHSMGGLVARAMIAERPEIWQRMCRHDGARLLMLGTPNGGSHAIVQVLLGRDPIVRRLGALDLTRDTRQLLKIVSRFPGLLEMLPVSGAHDFFDGAAWKRLGDADRRGCWEAPAAESLRAARALREALDERSIDPQRMFYVAGCAAATPVDVEIDAHSAIRIVASGEGDGRVPWETGRLPGVKTWFMAAEHGDLCNHPPAFDALLELLQFGDTRRLPVTAPLDRGAAARFGMPAEESVLYPDYQDLAAAALGGARRTSRPRARNLVTVSVTHGNLAFCGHAVAVGHYSGDAIVAAEAHLDRLLDGRLAGHYRLGLYPGHQDTAEVFLNLGKKPGGAIVIGLGQVGELSPGSLARGFARGALMYAMALADDARGGAKPAPLSASLSTLLIGTQAGGMTVHDAVAAMLRGVLQANRMLETTGYAERVVIERLEFVELYEDRAIRAVRALQSALQDPDLKDGFVAQPCLRTVPGGRRQEVHAEDSGWWRRLQVLEQSDCSLKFHTLTDLARVEVMLQPTQRDLVDRFLDEAVTTTANDPQVASTLFELLVPNRLKEAAPDQRDLVLVVDRGAARYPWELLQDRTDPEHMPLAVRAGLVRQLHADRFREQERRATGTHALVVGEPTTTRYPPLPAARDEARSVADTLSRNGFAVTRAIEKGAMEIMNALYANDYRILHLAGHGVYEYEGPDSKAACGEPAGTPQRVTGMVLGDDVFLTPAEINQMRTVPELVFINCCFLGRIEADKPEVRRGRHQLAANLAAQLIEMGVRAVVAAGWAVDDQAAQTFAGVFYQAMLAGNMFGDALLAARKATYERHKTANTWGAYQAYGEPGYTLAEGGASAPASPAQRSYAAASEAIVEADNIAADAKTADAAEAGALKMRLDQLVGALQKDWLAMAKVRAALGAAYGELDQFAVAISHYKLALEAEDARLPVHAMEQLSNLQARWALEQAAQDRTAADRARTRRELDEAVQRLKALIGFGETAERHSLLAGAYKRQALAMIAWKGGASEVKQALRDMVAHYGEAARLHLEREGAVHPYSLLNQLQGGILLDLIDGKRVKRAALESALREVEQAPDRGNEALEESGFWQAILPAECQLLRGLAAGDLGQRLDGISKSYLDARQRGASPREFRSVCEQIDFLIRIEGMVPGAAILKDLDALKQRLANPGR